MCAEKEDTIFKFYFQVKNEVDRILLFQSKPILFINEMIYSGDIKNTKIFNGEIPFNLKKSDLKMLLLGLEHETYYTFEKLFSIEPKFEKYTNTIIINAPTDVKDVIVEVPSKLQELLNIPKFLLLCNIEKNKVILFPENTPFREKLAHGIDPQAKTFISYVSMDLSKYKNLIPEILNILKVELFCVKCYFGSITKNISFR